MDQHQGRLQWCTDAFRLLSTLVRSFLCNKMRVNESNSGERPVARSGCNSSSRFCCLSVILVAALRFVTESHLLQEFTTETSSSGQLRAITRTFQSKSSSGTQEREAERVVAAPAAHDDSAIYLKLVPPERLPVEYQPASSEQYVFEHTQELGLEVTYRAAIFNPFHIPSCHIWTAQDIPDAQALAQYRLELAAYTEKVQQFTPLPHDLRHELRQGFPREQVCRQVDLHLEEIFKSQQLSKGAFGWTEPLLPPLRHPEFCFNGQHILNLQYMVHDWQQICKRLTPLSRTVFIDMGASLVFHGNSGDTPALYILETYQKFGIHFDHVYAFEITKQAPAKVFEKLPRDLLPSYHWINMGVESDPQGKLNPLRMLLEEYTEDDFVVIKLDIDTSLIEIPLAMQLLEDERLNRIVDQFYFEHHVVQKELAWHWKTSMSGSIRESLELFAGLRKKGIASHFWV